MTKEIITYSDPVDPTKTYCRIRLTDGDKHYHSPAFTREEALAEGPKIRALLEAWADQVYLERNWLKRVPGL